MPNISKGGPGTPEGTAFKIQAAIRDYQQKMGVKQGQIETLAKEIKTLGALVEGLKKQLGNIKPSGKLVEVEEKPKWEKVQDQVKRIKDKNPNKVQ